MMATINTTNPTSSKIFMIQLFRVKHCILVYEHRATLVSNDVALRHNIPGPIFLHLFSMIPITVVSIVAAYRSTFEEGMWSDLPIYIIRNEPSSVWKIFAKFFRNYHWRPGLVVSNNASIILVNVAARIRSVKVHTYRCFVANYDSSIYNFHILPQLEAIQRPGREAAFMASLG